MNKLTEYEKFKENYKHDISGFQHMIPLEFDDTFVVQLKPTDHCNFKCSYCYVYDNAQIEMDEVMANKYIDILDSLNIKQSKIFFYIYGGEPTMNSKLISIINLFLKSKTFRSKKIQILLQTNGLYWDTKTFLKNISELKKVVDIQVNISYHAEFANDIQLLKTIRTLLDIDAFDKLSYMITKKNLKVDILKLRIFQDAGVPLDAKTIFQESQYFSDKHLNLSDLNSKQYKVKFENGEIYTTSEGIARLNLQNFNKCVCHSGLTTLVFSTFGKVFRCDMDEIEKKNVLYDTSSKFYKKPLFDIHRNLICNNTFCCTNFAEKFKGK